MLGLERGAAGALAAMVAGLVASCSSPESSAQAAKATQVAVADPEVARAIDFCGDLVEREMMSESTSAQRHLARQAMGQDLGSTAMKNPDGRWRALVMRRATEGQCSTLITASCWVSLIGDGAATGDFTVRPTFARDCAR